MFFLTEMASPIQDKIPGEKYSRGQRSESWGTTICRTLTDMEEKPVQEEENQARVRDC